MSSFNGEHRHPDFSGEAGPSQPRPPSSDSEEEDIPFMVRRGPCQSGIVTECPTAPLSPPPPSVPIKELGGPAGIASTMTGEDLLHVRKVFGIPDSIQLFVPRLEK